MLFAKQLGYFWAQSQHLNFSLNLFITFFWTFCVLRKNLYFTKSWINETFLGSANQNSKNFTKSFHYTFLKFYIMIEFFGCFWAEIDIFHIYCTFIFLNNCGVSVRSQWFLGLIFISKFLVSVTFTRITTSAPALF